MKLTLEFAFLQDPNDFDDPEIRNAYNGIQTMYRQMLTTMVEGMVRSNENSDIDYVNIYLNDSLFDTVRPNLIADSQFIEVRILGYNTEQNTIDQIENGAPDTDFAARRIIQIMMIQDDNIQNMTYTDIHHLEADLAELNEHAQLPVKYHPTTVHYLLHYGETQFLAEEPNDETDKPPVL